MYLVGLYTYCRMMHSAYSVKLLIYLESLCRCVNVMNLYLLLISSNCATPFHFRRTWHGRTKWTLGTERRISVIGRIMTTFGTLLAVYTSSCCSNLISIRVNPQSRLEWDSSVTSIFFTEKINGKVFESFHYI